MRKLITKEIVKNNVNSANETLIRCFNMLTDIKYTRDNLLDSLLNFQPVLAQCLYELMLFYRELKAEAKELIKNKKNYVIENFKNIMKENAKFSEIIKEVITIGKSLGDAFAWFFYRNNKKELDDHFKHKKTGLYVSGIGGYGELQFVKNTKFIDGLFVLYHGITSMLRIGDFSLCDISRGVFGVGEIKTKQDGENFVSTVNISSKIKIDSSKIYPRSSLSIKNSNRDITKDFPRLAQQIKNQDSLLKSKDIEYSSKQYFDFEYDLINKLAPSIPIVINEDNSMILCGYWGKHESLFDILYDNKQEISIPNSLTDEISKIIDKNSNNNNVIITILDTSVDILRIPVFWWHIEESICKKLYFNQLYIACGYNISNLIQKFLNMGFTIKEKLPSTKEIVLEKVIGKKKIQFQSFNSLCRLATYNLMRTDTIFSCAQEVIDKMESGEIPVNSKVELYIHLNNFEQKH